MSSEYHIRVEEVGRLQVRAGGQGYTLIDLVVAPIPSILVRLGTGEVVSVYLCVNTCDSESVFRKWMKRHFGPEFSYTHTANYDHWRDLQASLQRGWKAVGGEGSFPVGAGRLMQKIHEMERGKVYRLTITT